MSLKKGTKAYSVLKMKCPHCHEGDFFVSHPYDLKRAGDIYSNCKKCGQKLSLEPGFYYGAMYLAYGFGIAFFVMIFIITYLIYPLTPWWVYGILISGGMIILGPYMYALSKIMWINFFVHYRGDEHKEEDKINVSPNIIQK